MKKLLLVILSMLFASSSHAGQCPGAHCSSVSTEINNICKSDGFSGSVVYVLGPAGQSCYCNCSCLAYGIPVANAKGSWKSIEEFTVGDSILTLGSKGNWNSKKVEFSDGTKGDGNPVPFTVFLELKNGIQLIVTPDHPFLLSTGKLQMASRLTLVDKLMNDQKESIEIQKLMFGHYTGGIHNVSTSKGEPGESMYDGHLINTAGIISGDFYAQLYLVEEAELAKPLMGTSEYPTENGLSSSTEVLEFMLPGGTEPRTEGTYKFTPYKKFVPPPGAVPFFPEGTVAKPGMLKPLSDPVPREIAEYLVHHFKRYYPNVTYHVEWADDTVNAYAWIRSGRRHVAILGGLIRHVAMDVEGIGLVLAHELGHHYGGRPTYPNSSLSCEGQSDYWASLVGMREVWWGPEYIRQMQAAIEQLDDLFAGIVMPKNSEKSFLPDDSKYGSAPLTCSHPPAPCRKETYLAGLQAKPKPVCAGFTEE